MCECWLFYLPSMGTLSFDFCIYGCHFSHTAWWKPIFIENCCFCKRIKPKIIWNPDLIFGLAEHLVTLWPYIWPCPLYHIKEMCHPDLIFWPVLVFGTWEYITSVMRYGRSVNIFYVFQNKSSLTRVNGKWDICLTSHIISNSLCIICS